jgi:hypothetical protein
VGRRARRDGGPRGGDKPRVVLVFGETRQQGYDASAVAHLTRSLLGDHSVRVEARREFLRLVKGDLGNLKPAAGDLSPLVKAAEARYQLIAIVKHEDTDALEPSHVALARAIERLSSSVGTTVYAAAAAWELEAWLLLWPEQVGEHRPSWRTPEEYVGRDLGQVANAKEALRRAVRPRGMDARELKRFPDYTESDSVEIARRIHEAGLARTPRGRSKSYARFVGRVDMLAALL